MKGEGNICDSMKEIALPVGVAVILLLAKRALVMIELLVETLVLSLGVRKVNIELLRSCGQVDELY